MNTVMQHRQDENISVNVDYDSELQKLLIYDFQETDEKLILKDEEGNIIATINNSFFYDSNNQRIIFLSKDISTFYEAIDKEYQLAIEAGFEGTKQEYFESRDYT